MGRQPRIDVGGEIYHALNRANGRATIFRTDAEYAAFENLLFETLEETGVTCLAFTVMPNHWHLLLKTYEDGALAQFMQLLTQAHTQHMHIRRHTVGTGHVYQGRYKSFIIDTDQYFFSVLKYIERNPVRAHLCARAEGWRWGSAHHRITRTKHQAHLNADVPVDLPEDYGSWINEPTSNSEIEAMRDAVNKNSKTIKDTDTKETAKETECFRHTHMADY